MRRPDRTSARCVAGGMSCPGGEERETDSGLKRDRDMGVEVRGFETGFVEIDV